jgi:DNA-directed RNA polymerase specialized sigma subunit
MTNFVTPAQREQDAANAEAARVALNRAVEVLLLQLESTADPMQGAVAATDVISQIEGLRPKLADLRRSLIRRAYYEEGMDVSEMARFLGISRARVDQILNDR